MTHYTTKIEKPLSLDEAREQAKGLANETGKPQPVYELKELETVQPDWVKGAWSYGESVQSTGIFRFSHYIDDKFYYSESYGLLGLERSVTITNSWASISTIKGLATPEQIEAHLSAAAVKMGFKEGVRFGSPNNICGPAFTYNADSDTLSSRGVDIYNGKLEDKWEKIISKEEYYNLHSPVLLTYRDEQGTLINIRATEVKINPLEGE